MAKVLLVDHGKASLVMSSEIVKELMSAVTIEIARTGEEAIEKVKTQPPYDLILVEFDMPDCDGTTLSNLLRKFHEGPILVCAYPDKIAEKAISHEMYAFDDARMWLKKPIRKEEFARTIDLFVHKKHAVQRRFFTLGLDTKIVGKAAGRGKRSPRADGTLQNISFGGACICTDDADDLKKKQDLTLTIMVPDHEKSTKKIERFKQQNFKAKVAWKKDDRVGIEFGKMTEVQRKKLEEFIKSSL